MRIEQEDAEARLVIKAKVAFLVRDVYLRYSQIVSIEETSVVGSTSNLNSNALGYLFCLSIRYRPSCNGEELRELAIQPINAGDEYDKFVEELRKKTGTFDSADPYRQYL